MWVETLWAVFDIHEESYEIGGRGAVTDLHLIERGDANHTQSSGSSAAHSVLISDLQSSNQLSTTLIFGRQSPESSTTHFY